MPAISCTKENPRREITRTGNIAYRAKLKNGEGEIRTLDTVSRMQSFQDCALNRSATSPKRVLPRKAYKLYQIGSLLNIRRQSVQPGGQ